MNLPFTHKTDTFKIGVRFCVFALLFILISGIVGPSIIATKLLYGYGFFIYGGLGKVVLFGLVAFLILSYKQFKNVKVGEYHVQNTLYIVVSFALIFLFQLMMPLLLKTHDMWQNLPLTLFMHGLLIAATVALLVGVFGVHFLNEFYAKLKKQLIVSVLLALAFYVAFTLIFQLWFVLSAVVLVIVKFFLSLTYHVEFVPPRMLILPNFAVTIEQTCSGIESLFMFSGLYILIGIIEYKSFNLKKLFLMFPVALFGLFFVNVLRVYLIILSGVLISPYVAQTLFHTYAGMILFIIYFVIFWKLCYGWMRK